MARTSLDDTIVDLFNLLSGSPDGTPDGRLTVDKVFAYEPKQLSDISAVTIAPRGFSATDYLIVIRLYQMTDPDFVAQQQALVRNAEELDEILAGADWVGPSIFDGPTYREDLGYWVGEMLLTIGRDVY